MVDRQLNTILNSGEITTMHLGGTSSGDKVIKASDLPTLEIGFADYNDLVTATTPIVIPNTSTFVDITNDGLGPFTTKTYLPNGITDVWNSSTNLFTWTELKLGDMVDIRLDLVITTTSANQEVLVALELGTGGSPYLIPYATLLFKTAGIYAINRYNGIYLGDANTINNGAKFKIQSDGNATLKVNGWYCKIILI